MQHNHNQSHQVIRAAYPSHNVDIGVERRGLQDRPGEVVQLDFFAALRERIDLGKIVATSGGFDPVHYGHGCSLWEARQLGDTLVVIVNGSGYLERKKQLPFVDLHTRCQTLCYMRGVDYVIPYEGLDDTVIGAIRAIRPHVFAKGGDWRVPEVLPERAVLEEIGAELVLGVGGSDKHVSSSQILADYRRRLKECGE